MVPLSSLKRDCIFHCLPPGTELADPIQLDWDLQGRLWVLASSATSPGNFSAAFSGSLVIIQDDNRDGKAETQRIFMNDLEFPTGMVLLPHTKDPSQVLVGSGADLLLVKDTDGDGKADQQQTLLTGFGTQFAPQMLKGFQWDQSGNVLLTQGPSIHSRVETPTGLLELAGGGITQYNPSRNKLHILARYHAKSPQSFVLDRWGRPLLCDERSLHSPTPLFALGKEALTPDMLYQGSSRISSGVILSGQHWPDAIRGELWITQPNLKSHNSSKD